MSDNPFAAPLADVPSLAGNFSSVPTLRVEGNLLVVTSEVVLPPFCVKSGQPLQPNDIKRQEFYWCHPAVALLILVNIIAVMIAYYILRKKCVLTYGITPEVRWNYRKWLIIKIGLVIGSVISIPLVIITESTPLIVIAVIFFIASVIFALVNNAVLTVSRHKNGQFWIKGCSPEFLRHVSGEFLL